MKIAAWHLRSVIYEVGAVNECKDHPNFVSGLPLSEETVLKQEQSPEVSVTTIQVTYIKIKYYNLYTNQITQTLNVFSLLFSFNISSSITAEIIKLYYHTKEKVKI